METVELCWEAVLGHAEWLRTFGEESYDHQSFYAGRLGRWAKACYYGTPIIGAAAVLPMVLGEAVLPWSRKVFHHQQRFPIADAHYAMGFALLARLTGKQEPYDRAVHFLEVLEATRSPGHARHGWGYPFDWVTRTGVMKAGTPLVTTLPYVYEAFEYVHRLDGKSRWLEIMESIAEHAFRDYPERELEAGVAAVGYNTDDHDAPGVVNASAYRAFLLVSAAIQFSRDDYRRTAERNLNFVLRSQKPDGSWIYAEDGVRDFVDHFHTCFVMKALAKIEGLTGHAGCRQAIDRGVAYYVEHLFDAEGRPRPFAVAPRVTVYRHELYDYAECINLGSLLMGRYPALDQRLESTLRDLLARWRKRDGSFRSRKLMFGWDNVPMHRWAQAQLFRSLCVYLTVTSPNAVSEASEPKLERAGSMRRVAAET